MLFSQMQVFYPKPLYLNYLNLTIQNLNTENQPITTITLSKENHKTKQITKKQNKPKAIIQAQKQTTRHNKENNNKKPKPTAKRIGV